MNYKVRFEEEVTELIRKNEADRDKRIEKVKEITDSYIDHVESAPDHIQLERLSNYILKEELKDADLYKSNKVEYPILSERQLVRRQHNEVLISHLTHSNGECQIDTEGIDHSTRNKKIPIKEQIRREWYPIWKQNRERIYGKEDEYIKKANNERKRKERESRRAGEVVVYYIGAII